MRAVVKQETLDSNSTFTIVSRHTIGRYAFIGAGAVVTMDVPDYALVLGSPARIAGWVCECGHRIDFENDITHCSDCGKQYRRTGKEIKSIDDQYGLCNRWWAAHDSNTLFLNW